MFFKIWSICCFLVTLNTKSILLIATSSSNTSAFPSAFLNIHFKIFFKKKRKKKLFRKNSAVICYFVVKINVCPLNLHSLLTPFGSCKKKENVYICVCVGGIKQNIYLYIILLFFQFGCFHLCCRGFVCLFLQGHLKN